jgi:hypothetical protein
MGAVHGTLPVGPVQTLGAALQFFETLRPRRHQKLPAEAIADLQPAEWFARYVDEQRNVDLEALVVGTIVCAPFAAKTKAALLFSWFDADLDHHVSNYEVLAAFEGGRRALQRLGVVDPLSDADIRAAMEREVCRGYLCYYKQAPPPTDAFALPDAMRWCALDPRVYELLTPAGTPPDCVSQAISALDREARNSAAKAKKGLASAPKPLQPAQEKAAAKLLPKQKALESWNAVAATVETKPKIRPFFAAVVPNAQKADLDVFEAWVEAERKQGEVLRRRVLEAVSLQQETPAVAAVLKGPVAERSLTLKFLVEDGVLQPDVAQAVAETFSLTPEAVIDEERYYELFVPEYEEDEVQLDYLRAFRLSWLRKEDPDAFPKLKT